MKKNKAYHWLFFLITGLVFLGVSFFLFRYRYTLRLFFFLGVFGGAALTFYGALNFLMDRLSDSMVRRIVSVVRRFVQAAFALLLVSFVAVQAFIVAGSRSDAQPGADAVIVLGAGLLGETPTQVLVSRLDAAAAYLKANSSATAVLSGGQGENESISEAEAMRRYLTAHGIPAERLLLEDRSTRTAENIRFSKELIPDGAKIVLVTNEFHAFRSRRLASLNGLDATVLTAPSPGLISLTSYALREYASVVLMFLGRT